MNSCHCNTKTVYYLPNKYLLISIRYILGIILTWISVQVEFQIPAFGDLVNLGVNLLTTHQQQQQLTHLANVYSTRGRAVPCGDPQP